MGYGLVHSAWVLVMSAVRLVLVGALVLPVVGCNPTRDVHEISGVDDKFCVPKKHVVGHIRWLPSDVPKGSGFAFSGCWRGDLKDETECSLPKVVVGGVTESVGDFRGQQWQDFGDGSLVRRTIRSQEASLEVSDAGRVVVAANPHAYWGWLVWRKAMPLAADGSASLVGTDELIATCQKKNVALPGTPKTREAVMCERKVRGKDYALSYSFESKERVPQDVEALDTQVFAAIDRWRCEK